MKNKMLMIDDSRDLLRMFEHCFASVKNWEFHSAQDVQEGWKKIAEVKPDLLVLDCALGEGNESGLEFLKKLRSSHAHRNLPVLILTGTRITPTQVAEGLNLGADNYVIKPITPAALIGRADALLRFVKNGHLPAASRTKALLES